MDRQSFLQSVADAAPPSGIGAALEGLWWDVKGDWERAHECAQRHDDIAGMRLHAYLHRKEGDAANANYWYRRAGVAPMSGSLADEWDALVQSLTVAP